MLARPPAPTVTTPPADPTVQTEVVSPLPLPSAVPSETSAVPPRIEVRLLGPFELLVGGQAVHVGSVKQRAVLALLALQAGKVVSSDTLCDVVWATDQPVSLSATLHSVISRLRGTFRAASGT